MLRRTPLKRGKRKAKSAMIQYHHARVAALGCLISGQLATLHHASASIYGGRISRDDRCVVPLAPQYHQKVFDPRASDPISVEGLSHKGFYERYGIDCEAEGWKLWRETERLWDERSL